MDILIKNACIIDPNSAYHLQKMDLKICNGNITEIAPQIIDTQLQEIAVENLHLSVGWIDSSVCFGEPGFEERETIENGLQTAAKSGFTHVVLNPNTLPVVDNQTVVRFLQYKSQQYATTLLPMGALTKAQEGEDLAELYDMKNAGAVAFGDYKKTTTNANVLKIALQYAQDIDGLVVAFSEDQQIKGKGVVHEGFVSTRLGLKGIPTLSEELIISRNLELLTYTGGKLHIPTISSVKSLELIKAAKDNGHQVSCSVAVHHLALTDEALTTFDTRYKVNPPLRDSSIQKALIEGVLNGTIDCITSDHQPLDIEHKKMEFDLAKDGTIGLESAFGTLHHLLPLETVIQQLTAAYPLFGQSTPRIQVGALANITFFVPDGASTFEKENIHSKSKNSAFLGVPQKGRVYGIYNNHQLIWNETN